jgi:hypothetical protein
LLGDIGQHYSRPGMYIYVWEVLMEYHQADRTFQISDLFVMDIDGPACGQADSGPQSGDPLLVLTTRPAIVGPRAKEWVDEDGQQCSSSIQNTRNIDGDRFDIPLIEVAPR